MTYQTSACIAPTRQEAEAELQAAVVRQPELAARPDATIPEAMQPSGPSSADHRFITRYRMGGRRRHGG